MEKIISLFCRNYDGDRLVRDEIVSGAEWVVAGEGIATVKWDGTCCLVRDNNLYKRYDAKQGKKPPHNFEPAQDAPDPVTGHWPGWLPIGDGPEDKWYRDAYTAELPDGTYELIGPKVQGNPYSVAGHVLVPHGKDILNDVPRTFGQLKDYLASHSYEGIVWHHADGRMVKIKRRDFGLAWPIKGETEKPTK